MIFEIFCSVDGNRDRWALSWRLARELAQHKHTVRLWVDDEHARRAIRVYEVGYFPMYAENSKQWYSTTNIERGSLDQRSKVQVKPWPTAASWLSNRRPPDVVIEAFGCGLPEIVLAEITKLPRPPVCVALNSFLTSTCTYSSKASNRVSASSLSGVTTHHLNAGVSEAGVLWEIDVEKTVFDATKWRAEFAELWLRRPFRPRERLISMCTPTNANALRTLYDLLESDPVPTVVLGTGCDPVRLRDVARGVDPGPNVTPLDVGPLSQDAFDDVLKGCDINFVCGEDSVVRAWKSGRPWVWQDVPSTDRVRSKESSNLLKKLNVSAQLVDIHSWWNGEAHSVPQLADLFEQGLWPTICGSGEPSDLTAALLSVLSLPTSNPETKAKRVTQRDNIKKNGSREELPPGAGYRMRAQVVEGKILSIGVGTYVDSFYKSVLRNCELRIVKTAHQSLNFEATFEDCDIRPKTPLKNKQMWGNIFLRCNFRGHYIGCDFGSRVEKSSGRVEDCDFSECRLHLTEFFDSELVRLKLPGWPHVYLLDNATGSWKDEWEKASLPSAISRLSELSRSRSESILALHLPDFGIDSEAVWPLIQDMSHVWFPGKENKLRAASDVSSSIAAFNDAAKKKQDIERDRAAIWHLLHRCWLRGVQRASDKEIDILFDSSFLQAKVPDAPVSILVRLRDGRALHRINDSVHEVGPNVDRFMLLGVGCEGDDIILKPHRKERGQIKLSFSSYHLFTTGNRPTSYDDLLDVVNRYLGSQ